MSTLKDAYIAEALEQIAALEEKINALPEKLEQSSKTITNSTAALDRISQEFRRGVEEYIDGQHDELARTITVMAQNSIIAASSMQTEIIRAAMFNALDQYHKSKLVEGEPKPSIFAVSLYVAAFSGFVGAFIASILLK